MYVCLYSTYNMCGLCVCMYRVCVQCACSVYVACAARVDRVCASSQAIYFLFKFFFFCQKNCDHMVSPLSLLMNGKWRDPHYLELLFFQFLSGANGNKLKEPERCLRNESWEATQCELKKEKKDWSWSFCGCVVLCLFI